MFKMDVCCFLHRFLFLMFQKLFWRCLYNLSSATPYRGNALFCTSTTSSTQLGIATNICAWCDRIQNICCNHIVKNHHCLRTGFNINSKNATGMVNAWTLSLTIIAAALRMLVDECVRVTIHVSFVCPILLFGTRICH